MKKDAESQHFFFFICSGENTSEAQYSINIINIPMKQIVHKLPL